MAKIFLVVMAVVAVLGIAPLFAEESSFEEFLKGNDTDDPLCVDIGIAKIIKGADEKAPDIRLQLDRKSNIGEISNAEYTISCVLEF